MTSAPVHAASRIDARRLGQIEKARYAGGAQFAAGAG